MGSAFDISTVTSIYVVLLAAIIMAGALMMFAIYVQLVSSNDKVAGATKDVLPVATALVGFAGGAVTAIFGSAVKSASNDQPTDKSNKPPKNGSKNQSINR